MIKDFKFKNEDSNKEKAMLKTEANLDNDESSMAAEGSFISPKATADIVEQDKEIYKEEKKEHPGAVTPTWKKEEVWVLHQSGTHKRTISQKVQLAVVTIERIIEEYTKAEEEDPEGFNADRDKLRNAFIEKAWEIIKLADDLTVNKLKEGKASALQANIIAGTKIDKVLLLQGKANQITEQKHYLDKSMFKDLAKILTKRTYEHE